MFKFFVIFLALFSAMGKDSSVICCKKATIDDDQDKSHIVFLKSEKGELSEDVLLKIDGEKIDLSELELEIGDVEIITTENGKEITIERTETGYELDIDGKTMVITLVDEDEAAQKLNIIKVGSGDEDSEEMEIYLVKNDLKCDLSEKIILTYSKTDEAGEIIIDTMALEAEALDLGDTLEEYIISLKSDDIDVVSGDESEISVITIKGDKSSKNKILKLKTIPKKKIKIKKSKKDIEL